MFVPSVITQHSHFYLSFVPTLLTLVLAWANLRHFPTLCDCERTASDEMKIRLGFSPLHLIDTIVSFQNGNIWLKFNLFMSEHFEMDSFNVVTIVLKSKWVYEHFVRWFMDKDTRWVNFEQLLKQNTDWKHLTDVIWTINVFYDLHKTKCSLA